MYGYDHFGMGLGVVGMILFLIVPLALLFLLFNRFSGRGEERRARTALEILDERYAQGEIDRKEYLERRDDLVHRSDAPIDRGG